MVEFTLGSYQQQADRANRMMLLYQEKLEARGFVFVHDECSPPKGMGHFAAMEISEQCLKEAREEAARPRIVPNEE